MNRGLLLLLLSWVGINLLQSVFLDITPDEAYYYVYSQKLQWGYYDHPPVVAALVKLGYSLIPNQVGVRLLFVLLSAASLLLIYRLTAPARFASFFLIVLACMPVHLSGFHALPDVPVVFFSLTFLLLVRRFLEDKSLRLVIPLALNIALLLLSKYHAILILLPVVVAVPALLKRINFWLAVGLAVVFLLPHFQWQAAHDFPSLTFHLGERNWASSPYTPMNSLIYLLIQPIVAGPLISLFLYFTLIKRRPKDAFERVLLYTVLFIYGFFFLMTFTGGDVHWHWTVMVIPALIILGIRQLDEHYKRFQRAVKWLFVPSILAVLVLRAILVYDFIPESIPHEKLHGYQNWSNEVTAAAGDLPVVFLSSYQDASRYDFYGENPVLSLGCVYDRRSHFDMLPKDDRFFGKQVLVLSQTHIWLKHVGEFVYTSLEKNYKYDSVANFVYYPLIAIAASEKHYAVPVQERMDVSLAVQNEHYSDADLTQNSEALPCLSYHFFKEGRLIKEHKTSISIAELASLENPYTLSMKIPQEPGKYKVKFGVWAGKVPPTHNSTVYDLEVTAP